MTDEPKTGTCASLNVVTREAKTRVHVCPWTIGKGFTITLESNGSPEWQLIDIGLAEWDALVKCVETVRRANQ